MSGEDGRQAGDAAAPQVPASPTEQQPLPPGMLGSSEARGRSRSPVHEVDGGPDSRGLLMNRVFGRGELADIRASSHPVSGVTTTKEFSQAMQGAWSALQECGLPADVRERSRERILRAATPEPRDFAPTLLPRFRAGDRVEAKFSNGSWYTASVAENLPNGSYNINWDDRDPRDRNKFSEELREPSTSHIIQETVATRPASLQPSPARAASKPSSVVGLDAQAGWTTLLAPVIAGATVISVASQTGFKIGDNILISGGGQSEMKAIAGFGSIILEKPLENGYPAGSVVKLLEVTATTTTTSLPPRMPEAVGLPRSLSPARVYVDTTGGRPLVTVSTEPQTTTFVTHPVVVQGGLAVPANTTPSLVEVVRSRPQSPSLERVVEPPVITRTVTPVRMPEPTNEVPTEVTLSVEPPKQEPQQVSLRQELCDELKEFLIDWFSAARFSDVPCNDEGYNNRGKKMDKATAALRREEKKKKAAAVAGEGSQNLSGVVPDPVTSQDSAKQEAEEEIEGDQLLNGIDKLQTLPIFVVLQCLGTFFMWALMSMQDTNESIGGLDAWYPGWTDLALTDLSCADYRSQAYRWWSYQFTHANFTHIATNVVLVVFMGIPLEGHNGTLGLFLMFNLGVFGGACCFMVNDPHSRVVGMSGGCYALLGMHVGDLVQNWKERKYNYAKLAMIMSLAVVDIALAFLSSSSKTSHSAHFGGWIAGCIACVVFGANTVPRRHEKYIMYLAALGGLGLTIFCLVWGLEWAPQNIWDQERYCWLRQIYSEAGQQWQCVICDSLECARSWSDNLNADFIKPVSRSACGDMRKVSYQDPAFAR